MNAQKTGWRELRLRSAGKVKPITSRADRSTVTKELAFIATLRQKDDAAVANRGRKKS